MQLWMHSRGFDVYKMPLFLELSVYHVGVTNAHSCHTLGKSCPEFVPQEPATRGQQAFA